MLSFDLIKLMHYASILFLMFRKLFKAIPSKYIQQSSEQLKCCMKSMLDLESHPNILSYFDYFQMNEMECFILENARVSLKVTDIVLKVIN